MVPQNCKLLEIISTWEASTNLIYRLFMHGGHTNHLADFSWNPNDPWLVASAAEDNVLQIWKPAESIVGHDIAEMPIEELDGRR